MLHHTSAFFLQSLFFFCFSEITGKDICMGRLFTMSHSSWQDCFCCICYGCLRKHCELQPSCFPSWMVFSHLQTLVCSQRQCPPSAATAQDYMPQILGPKVALRSLFFFFCLQDTWACACLCLWHKLLYTKLTTPASLMCKWDPPAITAPFSCYKLHKTPGSVRWQWGGPNWPRCCPRCCPRLGLRQGRFADARWRCFHSSSQHWR